jgi:DNA-binding IclR family transcriptional regulator
VSLDDLHVHDAIRRTLPATLVQLCDATGRSKPTLHRHLTRLKLLGCVTRTAKRTGLADEWREARGATWAHLTAAGVTL